MLITGARYSPQDNPVERMWERSSTNIANTRPATMAGRSTKPTRFFRDRTPQQNLAATAPWTSPGYPRVTDKSSGHVLRSSLSAGSWATVTGAGSSRSQPVTDSGDGTSRRRST